MTEGSTIIMTGSKRRSETELFDHAYSNVELLAPKRSKRSNCYFCHNQILDQWKIVLEPAGYACHPQCLKCVVCSEQIEMGNTEYPCGNLTSAPSCFQMSGYIYCLRHYQETLMNVLNVTEPQNRSMVSDIKCAACHCEIFKTEMVNRLYDDSLIHTRCFGCHLCQNPIMDYYSFENGYISCGCNVQPTVFGSTNPNEWTPCESANELISSIPSGHNSSNIYQQIPYQRHAFGNVMVQTRQNFKPKRDRTSFRPEQLIALKNYFENNPNPDTKEIEALCVRTQLSKRVVQVWFQNRRAKVKKETMPSNMMIVQTNQEENE